MNQTEPKSYNGKDVPQDVSVYLFVYLLWTKCKKNRKKNLSSTATLLRYLFGLFVPLIYLFIYYTAVI
jgi:hypothetical protein